MKRFCLCIFLIVMSLCSFSQADSSWTLYPTKQKTKNSIKSKPITNKVTLLVDDKIERLIEKDLRISEANQTIFGFRIQIFYGSGPGSKTEARNIQSDYVKSFPEENSYLIFQTPNFKIRVGDFRTRLEAEKHLRELKETFPNAFVVKDKINLPGLVLED